MTFLKLPLANTQYQVITVLFIRLLEDQFKQDSKDLMLQEIIQSLLTAMKGIANGLENLIMECINNSYQ